jgi:uroporphyrinogen decarboxylase
MIAGFPRPEPDAGRLFQVLFRKGEPDRVPLIEIHIDNEIKEAVLEEKMVPVEPGDRESLHAYLRQQIRFWYECGYDMVPQFLSLGYPAARRVGPDTAIFSRGQRGWREERLSMIGSESDLESYPWPDPDRFNREHFEFVAENLPPGMTVLAVVAGALEHACDVMGTENLMMSAAERPELVAAVCRRITDHLVRSFRALTEIPAVKIFCVGDDWGHKRGCFLSPQGLREYFLRCVREVCDLAHQTGRAFIFHSCGEMHAMMDILIDEVGIDAKHSFEEEALPVREFKRRYGDRVATLGGVDVDRLSRWGQERLRPYVRSILEDCAPGGGFAIGSGNSVTNYCPLDNYLVMLDETWKWNGLRP